MTFLSVVIPTFQRRDLLGRCLRALVCAIQNVPAVALEVIVADDEGSDDTRRLVESALPCARYVKGPGRGPAANRNAGAAQARGDWLVFIDDDCVPAARWLSAYLSAIHSNCRIYEGRTSCIEGLSSPLHTAPINETGGYLWSCNFMIERKLFQDLGHFDESFPFAAMEDVDFRERIRDRNLFFEFVQAASVEHPPRKLAGVAELLGHHQSFIYFQLVKRGVAPRLGTLLAGTMKFRLRCCFRPGIADLPKALWIYGCEAVLVCIGFRRWCRSYAGGVDGVRLGIKSRPAVQGPEAEH